MLPSIPVRIISTIAADALTLNPVTKRWFVFVPTVLFPVTLFYDAPFGRFSDLQSLFAIDGIKGWITMEIVAPISFLITAFFIHPFSPNPLPLPSLSSPIPDPQTLLASLYLVHYLNRALISPLRTPSRSPSHPAVVFFALLFNIPNGFLLASYLSSTSTAAFLTNAYASPRFWVGFLLWGVGFAGNIMHDDILLDIRRRARKGKAKATEHTPPGEHYAIPHGLLYKYVSFPNYLSEWVEWLGYALAASPAPALSLLPPAQVLLTALAGRNWSEARALLVPFADSVSPPWAFLMAEVLTMVPRAVRGHRWYKQRFGEAYPKGRWAVIPGLI
ncbi:hypothetical protein EWM64_g7494 [Hericium alpestre]|uniref:3-oxo-5-alpha-steroid 4-dehydrogenase C-terminal domain-containing protein n=1 Tax=Hericium alpestre TaxID=135208 RepID=A0A4Y9ZSQ7_9AGAM|nr:hypothetical protein EWM64_g7494 [Hericium alpestre]